MEEKLLVQIPLERYEELLDIESRVNVAADLIYNDRNTRNEVIFRVIGHSKMVYVAEKIQEEHKKFFESLREKENGD